MKKFLIFVTLIVLGGGGYFIGKTVLDNIKETKRIEEAKKGWYLEIITDDGLNVRTKATRNSNSIRDKDDEPIKLQKGEIYEIVDYNIKDSTKYWYQIKLKDGRLGWVANPKVGEKFIKDYNGEIDVATPTLKFKENDYYTIDIDHINYNHLEIWDDRNDYKVTYIVYHEHPSSTNNYVDQYWIEWTVTDASKKSTSKVQKIVFEKKPNEDEVINWANRNN